jgi:hypothetical protein
VTPAGVLQLIEALIRYIPETGMVYTVLPAVHPPVILVSSVPLNLTVPIAAELFIALLSFYGCGASVLNAHYDKTVLAMGKPFIKK